MAALNLVSQFNRANGSSPIGYGLTIYVRYSLQMPRDMNLAFMMEGMTAEDAAEG